MNLFLYLREVEEGFDFEKAVCNHGFFMMPPNIWKPKEKSLSRPLRLSDSSSNMVTISHPATLPFLVIQVHGINNVRRDDEQLIFQQVRRMLRFTSKDAHDVAEFHQLHSAAKENGFGRIFRSASLFEDMAKSILLCKMDWQGTLRMATSLCKFQAELPDRTTRSKKRARDSEPKEKTCGNFPSAKELAGLDYNFLSYRCKLGFRAKEIVKLAKQFDENPLDFEKMENGEMEQEQVIKKVGTLQGFGCFATATVLMCLGHYHLVPSDTETLRILQEVYGKEDCSIVTLKKEAQALYERFGPFQSLAYWFDLTRDYETKHGKLSELLPEKYDKVGGQKKQRKANEKKKPPVKANKKKKKKVKANRKKKAI